jgi:hypothetical protein
MRRVLFAVSAIGLFGALATPALAATTVGQTFTPDAFCGGPATRLQVVSPSSQYVVPSAGVLTSWSFQADGSPPTVKFKAAHPTGNTREFKVLGESALLSPTPSTLNTNPIRIPVQTGDVIGFFDDGAGNCQRVDAAYTIDFLLSDVPPSTQTFTAGGNVQLDVSARLEADADHDGFGDETQDECPTNGTTQGPCPVTPVKKKKCKKHKKHKSAAAIAKKCKKKHH